MNFLPVIVVLPVNTNTENDCFIFYFAHDHLLF